KPSRCPCSSGWARHAPPLEPPPEGEGIRKMATGKKKDEPKAGNTLADKLARLGIKRGQDMVLHLPLRYEDRTHLTPIAAVQPGNASQVEGTVVNTEIQD